MGLGTIRDAIKFSSNCAMKDVALKVGIEKMRDILEKFGIGGGTGVDLPAEARGTLAPSVNWGTTQLATTGYGYGIGNREGWWWHDGDIPGYTTSLVHNYQTDTTIIVMVNSDIPDGETGLPPAPYVLSQLQAALG